MQAFALDKHVDRVLQEKQLRIDDVMQTDGEHAHRQEAGALERTSSRAPDKQQQRRTPWTVAASSSSAPRQGPVTGSTAAERAVISSVLASLERSLEGGE